MEDERLMDFGVSNDNNSILNYFEGLIFIQNLLKKFLKTILDRNLYQIIRYFYNLSIEKISKSDQNSLRHSHSNRIHISR
jgi:hypothetical protein